MSDKKDDELSPDGKARRTFTRNTSVLAGGAALAGLSSSAIHAAGDDKLKLAVVGCGFENTVMGINYGFDKVRFLTPVRAGKRVRAHVEVLDIQQKDDNRFLIKQGVSVEIEGEENPALVAEWLSMVVAG